MNKLLSCDWGTTNFRLKLIDSTNAKVLHEVESSDGINITYQQWKLSGQPREAFYLSVIQKHLDLLKQQYTADIAGIPIVISGMASSSLGIRELPYAHLPFERDGSTAITATPLEHDFNHSVHLISGIRSHTDVMRGEETQWLGLMHDNGIPESPAVLFILPGTHSKHIETSAGRIVDFNTYMTGEFFSLLANHSVLKNSVETGHRLETAEDEATFLAGVRAANATAGSLPGNLLHTAFLVRTNELFGTLNRKQNGFFLSGLVIGCEVQAVKAKKIVLASGSALLKPYQLALENCVEPENITILSVPVFEAATIQGQIKVVNELIRYE